VIGYDTQTMLYDDLARGRVDAVLLDQPAAVYYGIGSSLKIFPVSTAHRYGVAMRKGDAKLLAKVNAALAKLIKSGQLRRVYERWGIWNPSWPPLFPTSIQRTTPSPTPMRLSRGARMHLGGEPGSTLTWATSLSSPRRVTTVELSLLSMSIAIALGLVLALMRLYGPLPIYALATVYVEFIRGSPCSSSSSSSSTDCPRSHQAPAVHRAVLGLAMNYGAYEARSTARAYRPSLTRRWKPRSPWA